VSAGGLNQANITWAWTSQPCKASKMAIVNPLGHHAWINLPSIREDRPSEISGDHCAHMIA
jgi:hypothetical protein